MPILSLDSSLRWNDKKYVIKRSDHQAGFLETKIDYMLRIKHKCHLTYIRESWATYNSNFVEVIWRLA